jgi:hypothetical protein
MRTKEEIEAKLKELESLDYSIPQDDHLINLGSGDALLWVLGTNNDLPLNKYKRLENALRKSQ